MEKFERVMAYYRTSSQVNVGEDKDSKSRQKSAVDHYASKHGMKVESEYYDAAVKGADPAMARPAFKKMFWDMRSKDIRTILVESPDRFARDLMVQMNALAFLKEHGISVIPVNAPDAFIDETPTQKFISTMMGAMAEFEKNQIVSKLKSGKDKKRAITGRCEGRIPPPEDAVKLAISLREQNLPYRKIGEELSKAGFRVIQKNKDGVPEVTDRIYQAASVKNMIDNYRGASE